MKQSFKNIFSVSAFLCFTALSSVVASEQQLSSEELAAAVKDMSKNMDSIAKPATGKIMDELVGANVRADSKEPDKFKAKTTLEFVKAKFDTSKIMMAMKKWGQIKIIVKAHSVDKNEKWTEQCEVKLYAGFNNCLRNGKMLIFKSAGTCFTLPTETEQSFLFFIPGDIRQKYSLSRAPDYCAIHITCGGISQEMIIINKEGKNAYQANPEKFHKDTKGRSEIENDILCNANQLPIYADIRVDQHPTLIRSK
jgi:hypothetical protein